MGKCFVHGDGCKLPGGEDEILLCGSCIEEIRRSVLIVCADCGNAYFLDPEFARETILADNPEMPAINDWLRELPIMLVTYGCGDCHQQETEAVISIQVYSGFKIEEGRVLL